MYQYCSARFCTEKQILSCLAKKAQGGFSSETWSLYCSIPFNCQHDIIRWFQYSVIHRIILTTAYLYKNQAVESIQYNVRLVTNALDIIQNAFVYCPFVRLI